MSYEPTNWQAGDTVTSAKLNKLEQGVASTNGGGILIVHEDSGILDKTWAELFAAETPMVVLSTGLIDINWSFVVDVFNDDGTYCVTVNGSNGIIDYTTDSENGYPFTEGYR